MIVGFVVDGFAVGVIVFFVVMVGAAFWMASAGWDFVRLYRTRVLGEDPRNVARSHWWLVSPGSLATPWRDPRIVWSPSQDPEVEHARRALLRRYFVAVVLIVLAMSIPFILEAIAGSATKGS